MLILWHSKSCILWLKANNLWHSSWNVEVESNNAVLSDCAAIYNSIQKYHCDKPEMGCDDPILLYGYVSFDAQACAICVLFFKGEQVLLFYNCVKQLLTFKVHLSIHAGVVTSGLILSLTTDILYISVFPGFCKWKWILMICKQELLMTASAASVDSPSK